MLRYCIINVTPLANDPDACPLSAHRRAKYDSCRHDSDRLLSLGAALALDTLLATCGLREQEMIYGENEYGKPHFVNAPALHFNLSHSGDYVLCVLSDAPVGCDVQETKPLKHDIPRRFFHPDEAATITAAPEGEREGLFFRYWARKEACIKATGKGLHLPLNSFRVTLDDPQVTVDGSAYTLTELPDLPGYAAAICAAGPEPPEQILCPTPGLPGTPKE